MKKSNILRPALLGIFVAGALSAHAQDIAKTDRLIVKYKPTMGRAANGNHFTAADTLRSLGLNARAERTTATGAQVLKLEQPLTEADAQLLADNMAALNPNVEYAEPDLMVHHMMTPNDPGLVKYQWDFTDPVGGMNLLSAWDKSTGKGVVVAVIDTGYRPHADLKANIVGGYDFISNVDVANDGDGRDADAQDPGDGNADNECKEGEKGSPSSWHGTHVAGTVAAVTNNSVGVSGVAPDAKVLPLRVLGKCGGLTSDTADAIIWAAGGAVPGVPTNLYPAKVINMSLGSRVPRACSATTQAAIDKARSLGAVVIVAAGNDNANADLYASSNCKGVISVGATDRKGLRAPYSNYGTTVTVSAPGGDTGPKGERPEDGILSTLDKGAGAPEGDTYAFYDGTSMATPHVAGLAALILSKFPNLTPDQVADRIKKSARPFPSACQGCGSGIADAQKALADDVVQPPIPGDGKEVEPNETLNGAQNVTKAGTIAGTFGTSKDNDYYKVTIPAGATLTATLTPNSSSDYDLVLYSSSGSELGRSEATGSKTETLTSTNRLTTPLVRYVRVVYYKGSVGSAGTYQLKLNW